MKLIIQNIQELIQTESEKMDFKAGDKMSKLATLKNAFLVIEEDRILDFGPMSDLHQINVSDEDQVIDASGKLVFPTWCDSHTHLVYAASRESEFVDRINGLSYEEIAQRGGGILNSANRLESASEDELFESASKRLAELIALGTGAVEMKSGYGLSLESELKILRVVKRLKANSSATIKASFLGAHAFPGKYKSNKELYIKEIIEEMIPAVQEEELADYIDVFCETNYFSVEDLHQVLAAGIKHGLKPKVHVNQFTSIGGIQKALEFNAISVDHLEVMEEKDINDLKNSSTIATLLPSCSLFISIPYAPAKKLLKNNK